ncbi:hypothetical protein RhiirA1_468133 [Rhizophagus irregularis]|uniref:MHD domain-containing protein n=3 Tax=Rhizophagus irregularis TaxID=588596 RepID=U9TSY7_RHIID|nr:hypothetical protein GLOIN_2v1547382 [Rhizophagus irregularis DAOM 181602=DAOM 197198]EXX77372.1 Syp1p [Rhizophagus irregularis DAOM 197198w]PKC60366.1 hypothetical protein RhiirA1_468133 [Rhizophagus irregularis]PKK73239.1 hypothetical protein RhiirC2_776259 [Rhizophagus irregularis]PKY23838.1 hypothetical protein RhiirB3_438175 [Rhizophagus irregularis]POG77490.1 hypothetical protein GLOIN_2v1547382 [Rhizophagus irregularis DAOM 181602=DAOM 197198]|eukprot:XP_025184356.1 hypothetical protein GLOIN_2v1547382 [Rhizophagus irregularis DAOM 181602=DAOM 197198]
MPYFQAFLNDNPKKAFDSVQLRLKRAKALNHDIATYFQDRVKIEEDYVKGLQRLATKTFVDRNSLGTFANVWDTLFNELHEIIKIQTHFIDKISEEVEVPLRGKATTDPEWSTLKNHESNLGKLTRDYEEKLQKVNKHITKSKSSKKADGIETKLAEAQKALEETKAELQKSWSTYLEKTQAIDLTRLVNLKETLARFETIQEDVCQRRVEMAEKTLGTVVDFDIQKEIEDFCSKKGLLVEGGSIDESSSSTGTVNQLKSAFSIKRKRTISQNYSEATFHPKIESIDSHSDGLRSPSSASFNNDTSSHHEVSVPKVVVDSEGYSIPPPEPKWDNFSSSNEENDSDARSEAASSSAQDKMRVEIKPTVVPENEEEAAAAMSLVMKHLNSTPNAKKGTLRGLKDQRRTTIMSANDDDTSTANRSSLLNSSPTSCEFPETTSHPRAASGSETQSHGLRASISETVNIISKDGEITKILITGEIGIQYNSTIRDNSHPIRIRIKNFETLVKSAPNTSYLHPVPDYVDQYEINPGLLGGTPVTVMKYQAHIDPESKDKYLPLQVTPHWKCEPNLTSLAVSYQVNSECKLTGKLSQLSFIVPVDGQVGNVQSKPLGVWSVEKQSMYWQIDDMDLSIPPERKRILARFETEKASNPAPTAVRFLCKGQLLSDISIEIVPSAQNGNGIKEQENNDNSEEFKSNFKFQEISCQVSSGKFIALP